RGVRAALSPERERREEDARAAEGDQQDRDALSHARLGVALLDLLEVSHSVKLAHRLILLVLVPGPDHAPETLGNPCRGTEPCRPRSAPRPRRPAAAPCDPARRCRAPTAPPRTPPGSR